jgi:hypothetical protein
MPNGTYGGVRGRNKSRRKLLLFSPTRFICIISCFVQFIEIFVNKLHLYYKLLIGSVNISLFLFIFVESNKHNEYGSEY